MVLPLITLRLLVLRLLRLPLLNLLLLLAVPLVVPLGCCSSSFRSCLLASSPPPSREANSHEPLSPRLWTEPAVAL